MPNIQDLSDEEMNSLTNSILKRYGIDFTCYEPKSLRRRIVRILNLYNDTSVHDLWVRFLRDPKFVNVFMNEVSVGMTSMFRDPVLWKSLKARLPAKSAQTSSLKVWHAGCSTGEEVYSLGIIIKETNLTGKVVALATDFNNDALDGAKKGVYDNFKMVENEENYKKVSPLFDFKKYYTSDGRQSTMDPTLVRHADFKYQNLITDPYVGGFDIIFCRNVMIYFDGPAKTKMLEKFHRALNPGGYLIIGFFDTMSHFIDNQKFLLEDEAAKIFRKA